VNRGAPGGIVIKAARLSLSVTPDMRIARRFVKPLDKSDLAASVIGSLLFWRKI
jgi:hypothetical protein